MKLLILCLSLYEIAFTINDSSLNADFNNRKSLKQTTHSHRNDRNVNFLTKTGDHYDSNAWKKVSFININKDKNGNTCFKEVQYYHNNNNEFGVQNVVWDESGESSRKSPQMHVNNDNNDYNYGNANRNARQHVIHNNMIEITVFKANYNDNNENSEQYYYDDNRNEKREQKWKFVRSERRSADNNDFTVDDDKHYYESPHIIVNLHKFKPWMTLLEDNDLNVEHKNGEEERHRRRHAYRPVPTLRSDGFVTDSRHSDNNANNNVGNWYEIANAHHYHFSPHNHWIDTHFEHPLRHHRYEHYKPFHTTIKSRQQSSAHVKQYRFGF